MIWSIVTPFPRSTVRGQQFVAGTPCRLIGCLFDRLFVWSTGGWHPMSFDRLFVWSTGQGPVNASPAVTDCGLKTPPGLLK